MMDKGIYHLTLMQVSAAAGILAELDLAGAEQALRKAETEGPYTDPTLYREAEASGLIAMQHELLAGARQLADVARRWQAQLENNPSLFGAAMAVPGKPADD